MRCYFNVRSKAGIGRLIYRMEPATNKKLSYRRGTARCVVLVEILPIATQQCRNYLYDKSWTKYQLSLIDPCDKIVLQTALDDLCDKL